MQKNSEINSYLVFSVILNYNSYDDTISCIHSLESSNYNNKIIIVDNASSDGSGKKLQKTFPQYTILNAENNGGYSAGNNIGIKFALKEGADYILVINNDATVSSDTIQSLVDVLSKNTACGVVSCKIFYERTKKIYASAGMINRALCIIIPLSKKNSKKVCEVSYLSGCVMLVRSSVFNKVGFFDEKYFMYFEDVEFSMRVGKYFKLLYTPNGVAFHKSGGGDEWYNYSPFYFYYSSRNRILVFGANSFLEKLLVIIANSLNIIIKGIALTFYYTTGRTKNYSEQINALWQGLKDGVRNVSGRKKEY